MPDQCGACEQPLPPDGDSPEFCDAVCQRAWQARQTDGYVPLDHDAAHVHVDELSDQRPQPLNTATTSTVVHHGERLEDLATQTVDQVAAQLAAHATVELWRGDQGSVRIDARCGHDHCAHVETFTPTDPITSTAYASTVAYAVLGLVRGHVQEQHPTTRAPRDGVRVPVWRLLGRFNERGRHAHTLLAHWTLDLTGYMDSAAMRVEATCNACARRHDATPVTIDISEAVLRSWLAQAPPWDLNPGRAQRAETVAHGIAGRLREHHDPDHEPSALQSRLGYRISGARATFATFDESSQANADRVAAHVAAPDTTVLVGRWPPDPDAGWTAIGTIDDDALECDV